MSELHVSEINKQLNRYFEAQNTIALADSSQSLYQCVAKTKLIPFCLSRSITRLDATFANHMDDYAKFIRDQGASAQTIQSYLTITKLFFSFHGHYIKHTYRIPRADKQTWDLKHEQRWFSEEDIALCRTYTFKKNHIRNHLLIRIFCETGARINEVANIRLGDINIGKKTLLLHHSKTTPRSVLLSPETIIYLKEHLKTIPAKDPNENIFPGKNMIYKTIDSMLKDLKLKRDGDGRGPHTFRHYVATYMRYILKMDLDYVSRVLGDTSEMVTSRYIHPTPDMLHNMISKSSGW